MKPPMDFAKILSDAENLWTDTHSNDTVRISCESTGQNYIITADNLLASRCLIDTPQLIYMDPPFYTKANYTAILPGGKKTKAFSDATNQSFDEYLTDISARIIAAHEMLADEGSLWIHLDYHAVHYVKLLADCVFSGAAHMINEVIWQYKSGGATNKRFSRKHDTLLLYAKNPKLHKFFPLTEKSYNRGKRPYKFKGVVEYCDNEGWFTVVNMKDVWQIDMVGRTSGERTGYATQKPMALLERIISSCSEKEDLCVDLYGGSGTLAAAANSLERRWVSIDENPLATKLTAQRLTDSGASFLTENINI